MKLNEALQLVQDHLEQEQYTKALKLLSQLHKKLPENTEVLILMSDALALLDRQDDAIKALNKAIKLNPKDEEMWLLRLGYHDYEEEPDSYEKVLKQALQQLPDNLSLLLNQACSYSSAGKMDLAEPIYQRLLDSFPDESITILFDLSSAWEIQSYLDPEDEETESIEDIFGMKHAIAPLERAIQVCDQIIPVMQQKDSEELWRCYSRKATLLKKLKRFEEATTMYDMALELLNDNQADQNLIDFINAELEACSQGEDGTRHQMIDALNTAINETLSNENINAQDSHILKATLEDTIGRIENGKSLPDALETLANDDPDEMITTSIASDIFKLANEAEPVFIESSLEACNKKEARHAEKATQILKINGFNLIGDFIPEHLIETLGKPINIRLFTEEEGKVSAAAYRVEPLWPGFLNWLIMVLTRQWRQLNIVELETEFSDGSFLISNNAGGNNPFECEGVTTNSLPVKTKIPALVDLHMQEIQNILDKDESLSIINCRDLDDIIAMNNRLRLLKNAYRQKINYVSDEELKTLLGKKYESLASKIRAKLNQLNSQSS